MNKEQIQYRSALDDYDGKFSGVVTIYHGTNTVYQRCFGFANISEKVKNSGKTKFGMASGSKIFTAVSVLKLIEANKLSLASKLKEYVEMKGNAGDITIRSLLTHTSGIFDYFDEENNRDYSQVWKDHPMYRMETPGDFLPLFLNKPLKFKPGTKFSYSNSGFVLLAHIIECISRKPFSVFVKERIFDVLKMENTGYFRLDSMPGNAAAGYIHDDRTKEWKTNIYSIPIIGGGDGGCFTTADDMNRFWQGLLGNTLLGSHLTQEMFKVHEKDSAGNSYGLGVWISKRRNTYIMLKVMILAWSFCLSIMRKMAIRLQ